MKRQNSHNKDCRRQREAKRWWYIYCGKVSSNNYFNFIAGACLGRSGF